LAIKAYVESWHLSQSPAFQKLLVEPLKPFVDIELCALNELQHADIEAPAIFCLALPLAQLLRESRKNLIWVPMWDQVANYPQRWWNELPSTLRIIAFSKAVAQRAQQAHLDVLHVQYFDDPSQYPLRDWHQPRTMLYWNRTGLLDENVLRCLCSALNVQKLLFRPTVDPGDPALTSDRFYRLPATLDDSGTRVEIIPDRVERAAYLNLLKTVHIFVAPRRLEGVGLTFLEAAASGCALIAADRPTMNEYVTHLHNGYLLPLNTLIEQANRHANRHWRHIRPSRIGFARYWYHKIRGHDLRHQTPVDTRKINWPQLSRLSLQTMGNQARQDAAQGYRVWREKLPELVSFIRD